MTMFGQPCDNLATTLAQPCDSFKIQGCAKVVTRLHCGNLVTMFGQLCHNLATMFGQPCHNLATVSKYKVVPRLCQGCDKVVKKHCGKVVTTLCQGCDNLVISVWGVKADLVHPFSNCYYGSIS